MVKQIPRVNVSHVIGNVLRVPETDQVPATVLECHKGVKNQPILIKNPYMLKREFGVDMDAYFAAGGGPFWAVRAAYGDPVAATHYVYDDATTGVPLLKIVAKRPGTKKIYVTAKASGSGITTRLGLIFEEEDGLTEYYTGIRGSVASAKTAIQNLVERINRDSDIVDIYFRVMPEGGSELPVIWAQTIEDGYEIYTGADGVFNAFPRTVLGSGAGNVAGTDGSGLKAEADQKSFDIISDVIADGEEGYSPSEIAHTEALKALEQVECAAVFCLKAVPYESRLDTDQVAGTGDIYAPYVEHINTMNQPENHAWRFGIVGVNDNMNMDARIQTAAIINNDMMVVVGQGIVDVNGVEYPPNLATMAVAGKIAATKYNISIWGGKASKALKVDKAFITGLMELPGAPIYDEDENIIGYSPATRADIIDYNEGGVLTFLEDSDGIKVREGITAVQQSLLDMGVAKEDEISVIRIINHAKYRVYEACYSMLGENLSDTYKADIEEAVNNELSLMMREGAIAEYTTTANIISAATGQVRVDIAIRPIHAARFIDATIVVL
jgi:hypothetical protein